MQQVEAMMESETKTKISRAFTKAAYWQIIITCIVALTALIFGGVHSTLSALAGGGVVVVGAYVGMRVASRSDDGSPGMILVTMLKAEAIKILVIALLLLLLFKFYQGLVAISLIGGLAGSALASGAGLRTNNNEKNK